MMRRLQNMTLAVALTVLALPVMASNAPKGDIADQVRHELVMLPYYSVFDNLEYSVQPDGTAVLSGEVRMPILKSDAGNVVKKVPGVTRVVNNIKVLPLSPFDNRLRAAEYRSIFGYGSLYRYAMGSNPSIHIIVDNGHVTLKGVVGSLADRQLANIRANAVPGVFSVTNDLRIAEKGQS